MDKFACRIFGACCVLYTRLEVREQIPISCIPGFIKPNPLSKMSVFKTKISIAIVITEDTVSIDNVALARQGVGSFHIE